MLLLGYRDRKMLLLGYRGREILLLGYTEAGKCSYQVTQRPENIIIRLHTQYTEAGKCYYQATEAGKYLQRPENVIIRLERPETDVLIVLPGVSQLDLDLSCLQAHSEAAKVLLPVLGGLENARVSGHRLVADGSRDGGAGVAIGRGGGPFPTGAAVVTHRL